MQVVAILLPVAVDHQYCQLQTIFDFTSTHEHNLFIAQHYPALYCV